MATQTQRRATRRKPIPHLTYSEPLYAVCCRDPRTGEIKILYQDGPLPKRSAQYFANLINEHSRQVRAYLCPIDMMHIDTTPIDESPAIVVLEPSGKVSHFGTDESCRAIALEYNRLEDERPSGQRAIVKAADAK